MLKIKILMNWIIFIILPLMLLFYYYSGTVKTVTRIVDGDTIYFDKRYKCRLDLVDTPESHANDKLTRDREFCKVIAESRFIEAGLLSKQFVENILPLGEEANVYILDVDKYARNICKITLARNKKNISVELVSNGFAIPFFRFISSDEKNKWLELVMLAKKNKIGLWGEYSDVMNCMLSDGLKN